MTSSSQLSLLQNRVSLHHGAHPVLTVRHGSSTHKLLVGIHLLEQQMGGQAADWVMFAAAQSDTEAGPMAVFCSSIPR